MTDREYKKGDILVLTDEDIAIKCPKIGERYIEGHTNVITLEKNTLIQFERNDRRERNVNSKYTAFFASLITAQKDAPSGQILYLLKLNTDFYKKSTILNNPKMPLL